MSSLPDIGPEEARSFAQAEEASENLSKQVERARQALSRYHADHPVLGIDEPTEAVETARELAAKAADQPDLHPKA